MSDSFSYAKLLRWYRRHRRDLPFRPAAHRPANPYHVMVSEAMAQQTQIATVVPYFERFVAAFPTVDDLAQADPRRVLSLWQGLGYYRRARHLQEAARLIVEQHRGRVPRTLPELLKLPGVGRYSAGAIASVAYNLPAPIVDGNVARVYARHDLIRAPVDRPETLKRLWALAEDRVQAASHPRDYNQAVMELGALVCTPKNPRCLVCPLRESCRGLAAGCAEELPHKTPKKKPIAVAHTVFALCRRDRFLFEQRPARGLWASLWQLPTLESPLPDDLPGLLLDRFGLRTDAPEPVAEFSQATTHRAIRFTLLRCPVISGRLRARSAPSHPRPVWRSLDNLDDLPLAKPQLTALSHLRGDDVSARPRKSRKVV
ncbi:MAG: A/G-specific adenine glycosylase [Planctomycetota bacterium]